MLQLAFLPGTRLHANGAGLFVFVLFCSLAELRTSVRVYPLLTGQFRCCFVLRKYSEPPERNIMKHPYELMGYSATDARTHTNTEAKIATYLTD